MDLSDRAGITTVIFGLGLVIVILAAAFRRVFEPFGFDYGADLAFAYFLWNYGALAVAIASTFPPIADRSRWWLLTMSVALAAGTLNLVHTATYAGVQGLSIILRDVIGSFVLVATYTLLGGVIARVLYVRRFPSVTRMIAVCLLTIPFTAFMPLAQFAVHCSSGDCI